MRGSYLWAWVTADAQDEALPGFCYQGVATFPMRPYFTQEARSPPTRSLGFQFVKGASNLIVCVYKSLYCHEAFTDSPPCGHQRFGRFVVAHAAYKYLLACTKTIKGLCSASAWAGCQGFFMRISPDSCVPIEEVPFLDIGNGCIPNSVQLSTSRSST